MRLSEAVFRLKAGESELRHLGVTKLFVFGSTVRGDARPDSDVDLFIEDDGTIGLFDVMDIGDAASAILERTADVRTRESLSRFIRPYAEAEAVPVF